MAVVGPAAIAGTATTVGVGTVTTVGAAAVAGPAAAVAVGAATTTTSAVAATGGGALIAAALTNPIGWGILAVVGVGAIIATGGVAAEEINVLINEESDIISSMSGTLQHVAYGVI